MGLFSTLYSSLRALLVQVISQGKHLSINGDRVTKFHCSPLVARNGIATLTFWKQLYGVALISQHWLSHCYLSGHLNKQSNALKGVFTFLVSVLTKVTHITFKSNTDK